MPATRRKFSSHSTPTLLNKYDRHRYQRERLNLPGPIDRWLQANELDAWRMDVFLQGYLTLSDVRRDQVLCTVERSIVEPVVDPDSPFTESPTYMLHISACTSDMFAAAQDNGLSPRALLAMFTGTPDDLAAPSWVHWTRSKLEFRQPRAGFLSLFLQLAMWHENLTQRGLPAAMFSWAAAIAAETWAASEDLAPATPSRPTTALNARSVKHTASAVQVREYNSLDTRIPALKFT
ncbi:hypothetical protein FPV67DRAFT_1746505 [Lyophyllum atratum]|nr:hypothetical protein FPV67DRAFT_1746505 [Lyophyllum atratum]